jgi:hypothetical protein
MRVLTAFARAMACCSISHSGSTAIVAQGEGSALLQFNEGFSLSVIESKAAIQLLESRFAEVTLPFMTEKNATRYAWLLPGEQVSHRFTNSFGGFLYQFVDDEHECRFFPVLSGMDNV